MIVARPSGMVARRHRRTAEGSRFMLIVPLMGGRHRRPGDTCPPVNGGARSITDPSRDGGRGSNASWTPSLVQLPGCDRGTEGCSTAQLRTARTFKTPARPGNRSDTCWQQALRACATASAVRAKRRQGSAPMLCPDIAAPWTARQGRPSEPRLPSVRRRSGRRRPGVPAGCCRSTSDALLSPA